MARKKKTMYCACRSLRKSNSVIVGSDCSCQETKGRVRVYGKLQVAKG